MFHQYPEPSWCEFYTTSKLVEQIRKIGVDELYVGPDALDPKRRLGVPNENELENWRQKALEKGASKEVLKQTEGGLTGLVAVLDRGEGPVVGLRVDIDALPFNEADDTDHKPAVEGFRSDNDGIMHACGHDGHMAMGLSVLEEYAERDFGGTLKVFFSACRGGSWRRTCDGKHRSYRGRGCTVRSAPRARTSNGNCCRRQRETPCHQTTGGHI